MKEMNFLEVVNENFHLAIFTMFPLSLFFFYFTMFSLNKNYFADDKWKIKMINVETE